MGLLDSFLGATNPLASYVDQNRNLLGAVGAGLGAGVNFGQGLGDAAQLAPKAAAADRSNNATAAWLEKMNPDLANMVRNGAMSPGDAFNAAFKMAYPTPISISPGSVLVNPYTGAKIAGAPANPMAVAPGSQLFNPQTGQRIAATPPAPMTLSPGQSVYQAPGVGGGAQAAAGPGGPVPLAPTAPGNPPAAAPGTNNGIVYQAPPIYRPLTAPAERAKYGISPNDQSPYQLNMATGKAEYAGNPNTDININNKTESAFSSAVGEARGANYKSIVDAGNAAQSNLQTLSQLSGALSSAGYQGPAGDQVLALRKLGAGLGIDVQGTSNAQVAQSLSNQLALKYRNPASGAGMPGSLSNSDRDFLKSMVPGLSNTKEGNQLIINAAAAIEQRKIVIANLADQYIAKNGTLDSGFNDVVTAYNNAHPIFGGQTSVGGAKAPITSGKTASGVQWSVSQ